MLAGAEDTEELEEDCGFLGRFRFKIAMTEMMMTSSAAAAAMPSIFS